jgi:glutamine synthetase
MALEALNADKALCEAVGQELVDNHTAIKEQEWQGYIAHTSDWEFDQYLKYI